MTITRYVVCKDPDEWGDAYDYGAEYDEAKRAAQECDGCVIAIEYEFSDTELVDDFRPVHLDAGPRGEAAFCCVDTGGCVLTNEIADECIEKHDALTEGKE